MTTTNKSLVVLKNGPLSSYRMGYFLCQVAESICCRMLANIKVGRLYIAKHDGILSFGDDQSQIRAKITVKSPQFWLRVLLFNTLVKDVVN